MLQRPKMVGWYNPPRLLATAVRVAISTVFGEFADRRESIALSRGIDPEHIDQAYDFRAETADDFWFDFVADTGDGWDSTFAIARLLAKQSLNIDGCVAPLPRGRLLVMGGDQVYPTPSRDEYQARLVEPYEEAARISEWPEQDRPALFAIPGNHDWYDGLQSFVGLFCSRKPQTATSPGKAGRTIGGRQTLQTRSYFALALPNNWWLWAADVQLAGYIDQAQVDFFSMVARKWMDPSSRVILCTGGPEWTSVDPEQPSTSFRNFCYLESLADLARKKHRLCVVLTGDSHHYSRYIEADRHYITAGGGGAFLHPTHHLTDKVVDWPYPPPGEFPRAKTKFQRKFKLAQTKDGAPAVFPKNDVSRALSFRNIWFAFLNPAYTVTLGIACALFAWMLDGTARLLGSNLPAQLVEAPSFVDAIRRYLVLALISPGPVLCASALFAAYIYFADFKSWRRLIAGSVHAALEILCLLFATIGLARYAPGATTSVGLIFYVAVVGGLLSATMMGAYLLVSLSAFGRHWNEAFSSLGIKHYKNFLRFRISTDGQLTIYPVGLTAVPTDRENEKRHELKPHLIEEPIAVR